MPKQRSVQRIVSGKWPIFGGVWGVILNLNQVKRSRILTCKKLHWEINIDKKSYIFKYERRTFHLESIQKSQDIRLNTKNCMLQKINKILKDNSKFNYKNTYCNIFDWLISVSFNIWKAVTCR